MKLNWIVVQKFFASALAGFGIMWSPMPALALVIDINTYLTGSTITGNASVATLTLIQNGSNVDFRFDNLVRNLSGGIGSNAFISELLFSYGGSSALKSASFSDFGGTHPVTAAAFGIDPPGKDAGYDFYLDLKYPTDAGDRFFYGEFSVWTIKDVFVSDFVGSVSGNGPASLAMVHIQQVDAGSGGSNSVKYVGSAGFSSAQFPENPIPEPGSLALISLGLLGLCVICGSKKTAEVFPKELHL